jgi:hypothetical protein
MLSRCILLRLITVPLSSSAARRQLFFHKSMPTTAIAIVLVPLSQFAPPADADGEEGRAIP